MEYLKDLVPRLKAGDEFACLAFDEMHLTEKAEWDRKIDAVLGPNRQANVFFIRSIFGSWKMPVYVDFEPTKDPNDPKLPKGTKKLPKIPKFLLMQIIIQLEAIGIKVMSTVCDMSGDNQALAKELGINTNNVTFPNPWEPERPVFFSFDWVHGFKNLRNHLLDDNVTINGVMVNKLDILKLRGVTEIRGGFKLEDQHFYCKGQDRQVVKYAVDLLSIRSANLCRTLYPNDPKMQALADLFTVADNCFKIMTSTTFNDKKDKRKNALEVNLEEQLPELNKIEGYLRTMKFSGKPRFHKGMIIAKKAAVELQQYLAENGNQAKLLTGSIVQDFLESFFGVVRAMGGSNTNPDTFMFLQRIKFYIVQKILEDDNFDIFTLKETLEQKRDLSDLEHDRISDAIRPEDLTIQFETEEENDHVIAVEEVHVLDEEDLEIFEALQNAGKKKDFPQISYEQGIEHLAAAIASHFREDESLGTVEIKSKVPRRMFDTALNKGGFIKPSEEWLADVTKMDEMFMNWHPKDRLQKGVGLVDDFTAILVDHFYWRDPEVVGFFVRVRTRARIRHMNRKIMAPKNGTLRGRRKLVEWLY